MKLPRNRKPRRAAAVIAIALTGALAAVTLPSHAATGSAGSSGGAEHGYIVTLKPGTRAASEAGRDLADKYGARISLTYRAALNGYAVKATSAEADRLAADPSVAAISRDATVRVSDRQINPPSWGLDRVDQRNLPLNRSYTYPRSAGAGATVYVIDTGVRTSHRDFGGRARSGFDFVDNDPIAQDGNGHGTHVAGTVAGTRYGVAKKARIVAVRVLNNQGMGTISQVIAGVDYVTRTARKPAVANMSLGGGANAALDAAVRRSIASGVTYSVAAGNSGLPASGFSPARVPQALTVGASSIVDARAPFSNYGLSLDLFAPGVGITSASNASDTASATLSGTSMAAPHVAGAAAVYLGQRPSSTPARVAQVLTDRAVRGKITSPGLGSPNRLLQVKP
ncbi:S8 family peptidase [Streptomyces sp. G45]|uniref:S8 family peptidase n=1 Tax=Streptomyces sp. G45 TaxID=3406627 RepID=UPI003C242163